MPFSSCGKYKRNAKQIIRRSCTFVDLEKAFDRVPKEVVRWALRKLGVDEWLIRIIMALYTEACTVVKTDAGLSESFDVKVGLHQGSVLGPLLFAVCLTTFTLSSPLHSFSTLTFTALTTQCTKTTSQAYIPNNKSEKNLIILQININWIKKQTRGAQTVYSQHTCRFITGADLLKELAR